MNAQRFLAALANFLMIMSFTFAQPGTTPTSGKRLLLVPSSYSTIQAAINASVAGDTVLVSPGIYYENINYFGKPVMVASNYLLTGDSTHIVQTIIDGQDLGPVVRFENGESSTSLLVGFTVRNGNSSAGGGIRCISSDPIISSMIIRNNDAQYGGGIYLYDSYAYLWRIAFIENHATNFGGAISCDYYSFPAIYNVVINGNTAPVGAGLHCYYSSPYMAYFEIYNCQASYGAGMYLYGSLPYIWEGKIYNNSAVYFGGAIECDYYSEAYLTFLQISNNTAQYGAGIHLSESNAVVINSTIVSNTATYDGGGIYCYYSSPYLINNIVAFNGGQFGIYVYDGLPSVSYSDVWLNNGGNYFNCGNVIGKNVKVNINNDSCDAYFNVKVDPLFVNFSQKNYNLQSTSHCIDAGHPESPENPDHSIVDIGKYYYLQTFVASFTADTVHGMPPLTVHFSDNSIGNPSQYQWDFQNDGIIDSYQKNPVFTYTRQGIYSVRLKITKGPTSDIRIKNDFIKCTYPNAPQIQSVTDVPNDQGGWVTIDFWRSFYDSNKQHFGKDESYLIEYETDSGWVEAGTVAAAGNDEYTALCKTPADSTAENPGLTNFRVTARMTEGDFSGNEMAGYSVDNLAPQVPQELVAIIAGQLFNISWTEVPDPDLKNYLIYKSDAGGVFGTNPWLIATHPPIENLTIDEIPAMIKICAADSSGNYSQFSETIDAPLLMNFTLDEGWNDISSWVVPANPAFQNMFSPLGNDLIILQNLTGHYYPALHQNTLGDWDPSEGYWLKLSGQNNFQIIGFEENNKTIQLNEGWNLIPVLSRNAVSINELADLLGNDLIVVHEALGIETYWPSQNISTLEFLLPKKSYLIKMSNPGVLTFPNN